MSKIRINLGELYDAISRYDLTSYRDNRDDFEVELNITSENPGEGDLVSVLTITLDKEEEKHNGLKSNIRKIVEIFPANRHDMSPRVTTQETQVVPKKKKKGESEDDIPF